MIVTNIHVDSAFPLNATRNNAAGQIHRSRSRFIVQKPFTDIFHLG